MKQIYFFTFFLFTVLLSCKSVEPKISALYKPSRSLPTDEPAAMMSWEYERVKNPVTGDASRQHLVDIYNQIQEAEKYGSRAAVTGITWKERGPNNIGGRTRSIIFDLKDTTKKRVYAASVGGGLFRCNNIDSTIPTWNKINDFFSNLAITTIAQNPTNPDTIYFGTGEGFFNADAIGGAGVWRTANNGLTWTQLPSIMNGSVPFRINRMAVTKQGVVYAATNLGLYKSINGGNTWITELRTTGTVPTVGSNNGFDVKVAMNGDVYYACNAQVWKNTKATGLWSNVSPPGSFNRIEIACAPSDSNFVYLICQGTGSSVTGFFSSNTSGSSWRSRAVPLVYDQAATATTELSRGQAWYDLCLAVDPFTPTTVYAGGIEYIKSIDTGATYKQITAWSLFAIPGASNITSNQAMHSDHHALVFKPGSNSFAIFGSDGGLYRSTNMNLVWPSLPSYKAINTNYNVTQYYSCAIANVIGSNNMLGGAQDNGSLKYNSPGINAVTAASGGDGCYVFIDQNNNNNQITSYVYNNYYRSTNATTFSAITGSNNTGSFVNPTELDSDNDILYSYGGTNVLSRWTGLFGTVARTNITLNNINATGIGAITHIKCSPNNASTVYIGTSTGRLYRVKNANSITSPYIPDTLNVAAFGGRISSIDIRKAANGLDDTILVTMSNYGLGNSVLVTTNGSSGTPPTWTDIDNATLPDMPINWCLFAPVSKAQEVMLATEMGIYTCDNIFAASPVWGQSITGFANVRVDMIKMRSADSVIVAGTHGRGIFTTDKYTSPRAIFSADKLVTYIAAPVQFYDESVKATSWQWDFDNNGSIDDTVQNPIWSYGTAGMKSVRLIVNGGANSFTRNLYIQVLPNRGLPYTLAQGGDFETNANDFGAITIAGTAWQRGNSAIAGKSGTQSGSNAWVTGLTATNYANNSESYLYTPCFNMSAAALDTIQFFLKNAFEISYDGMRVEYSTDLGATWNPLSTAVKASWYDYANPNNDRPFPQNQAYFNANNTSFSKKLFSVSFLTGNKYVAFRFVFKSDFTATAAGAAIDNFEITSTIPTSPYQHIETVVCSKSEFLGPNDTVTYYSPNGKILAVITNLSAHNYGLTRVEIDKAGVVPRNYSINTINQAKISGKTYAISPSVNDTAGVYQARFFYTNDEIRAWSDTTGYFFNAAKLLKCPIRIDSGLLSNAVYSTSPAYGLFNVGDSSIAGNFNTGFSGFAFGGSSTLLPVVLLDFTGTKMSNYNQLNWSTASEKNNDRFEIERSGNGLEYFKIGEVKGHGNSFLLHKYRFDDAALDDAPIHYYRLKQIDYDGQFAYSKKIAILNRSASQVTLFPNPAKTDIQISTEYASGFKYRLYNAGSTQVGAGFSPNSILNLSLEAVPKGHYIIEIEGDNQNMDKLKFVKE